MHKFFHLLSDELVRARHYYLGVVLFVLIAEIINLIFKLGFSLRDPITRNMNPFDFNLLFPSSSLFILTVVAAAMAMLIYAIISWQGESTGKARFIYRLLTLPGSRFTIPLSKIASVLLMVFGLLALQLLIFGVAHYLCRIFFAETYVTPTLAAGLAQMDATNTVASLALPMSFPQFLINYGWGMNFLFLLFNVMMLTDSFDLSGWLKKLGYPLLYTLLIFAVVAALVIFGVFYLTTHEFMMMQYFAILLLGIVQLLVMQRIANHHLTI
ncbi:MAG: hypothetical protein Q4A67_00150 [Aerococcus sp.]|nr:hypothetical protein [Aerococcus sp.]